MCLRRPVPLKEPSPEERLRRPSAPTDGRRIGEVSGEAPRCCPPERLPFGPRALGRSPCVSGSGTLPLSIDTKACAISRTLCATEPSSSGSSDHARVRERTKLRLLGCAAGSSAAGSSRMFAGTLTRIMPAAVEISTWAADDCWVDIAIIAARAGAAECVPIRLYRSRCRRASADSTANSGGTIGQECLQYVQSVKLAHWGGIADTCQSEGGHASLPPIALVTDPRLDRVHRRCPRRHMIELRHTIAWPRRRGCALAAAVEPPTRSVRWRHGWCRRSRRSESCGPCVSTSSSTSSACTR